jgi:hypothetical protein
MNGAELARMIDSWSDALNVAEVIDNPFLRVGDRWDLHDWQTRDLGDGIHFQRHGVDGRIAEEVAVIFDPAGQYRVVGPARVNAAVPTWMVLVGPEHGRVKEEVQSVI